MEYLESVLKKPDWINLFPSLRDTVDNDSKFGSWKDGKDYLKMSGQDKGADRGDKIKSFNDDELGTMKLFLISSRAGGIGINLCSANRVRRSLHVCFRDGFPFCRSTYPGKLTFLLWLSNVVGGSL